MTRSKSVLCASLLTLAISATAFAGDIHSIKASRSGDIHSVKASRSGDIHSIAATRTGDIHGLTDSIYGSILMLLATMV